MQLRARGPVDQGPAGLHVAFNISRPRRVGGAATKSPRLAFQLRGICTSWALPSGLCSPTAPRRPA